MNPELVDATALDRMADRLAARGLLPHLVRRLLGATPGVKGLVMPAEEGIAAHGFDGVITGGAGNAWVPAGASVWEMGTGQDPRDKAQKDYVKRTADPLGAVPVETAFVFVTPRRWEDGQDWAVTRQQDGTWREVVVLDAESLHAWLEATPDVHIWLSERLGFHPLSVHTLSRMYEMLSARTRPPLPPPLLLAGRDAEAEALRAALAGPPRVVPVRGGSREEAAAFMAAALGVGGIDADRAPDQPVWVGDARTFERLVLDARPMQLVVTIDDVELGDADARGNHVLLALGRGDYERSGVITLPRPARTAGREALEGAGVAFDRADQLAVLSRRSFSALLREMSGTQAGARPGWATGTQAPLLAALLLLGGWEGTDGDNDVIQATTGRTRTEVEEQLAALSASDDAPWTRSGGAWRLVSAEDSFALVGELLGDELLSRWRAAAREVLGEVDARLGMDMGERMLANMRREALPRFSPALRHGLARGAALLGGRGAEALPSGAVPARHATRLVTDVLRAANDHACASLWMSLEDVLPELAEAAPDAFLDAIRDGMDADPSPIFGLFEVGQDETFSHPPHTGLLWALERIAWSPERLTRVTLVLGELAEHDPEGRWSNRPVSTLRATFLAWYPNTDADLTARLAAIDALRTRWPEAAWRLQLALLPKNQELAPHSARPRFRDWGLEWRPVAPEELIRTIHELVGRLAQDADQDTKRWTALVAQLYALPPGDRDGLLRGLASLDPAAMDRGDRLALWLALVEEGERHLRFKDADWSLSREQAEELLATAERFADETLPERHARLFDERFRLTDIPRGDYDAQRRAVATLRERVAADVLGRDGVDGLERLAQASSLPRLVGWAVAAGDDDLAPALVPRLGGDGVSAAMAAGWVGRRAQGRGVEWAREQLDTIELDDDAKAALLLELPPDEATWGLLGHLGSEVESKYWRAARPFDLEPALLSRAVQAVLEHDRPWVAVDLLASSVHNGDAVDVELAVRVLEQAAASEQVDAALHAAWEVGQLLDALQAGGLEAQRLARLEFSYFAWMENVRPARALEGAMASEPELFVQLVRYAYVRADGADDQDVRPEVASHAWQVLHDVGRLPGADEQGSIDPEALRAWVTAARRLLAEADRAELGDSKIGEFLSRSRPGSDGIWPAEPVRDLIEELRSDPFEDGLRCGRFNQRGTTVRDPYDGGTQEATLAASLREDAARLQPRWDRTARNLRTMAEGYEADAHDYDRDAERRSDNS
jgi:hypothetical protein